MYKLILQRLFLKRSSDEKLKLQLDHLVERGLAGPRGKNWTASRGKPTWSDAADGYSRCEIKLTFQRTRGRAEAEIKQWDEIAAMIAQTGSGTKYPQPWRVWEDRNGKIIPLGENATSLDSTNASLVSTDSNGQASNGQASSDGASSSQRISDSVEDALPDVQTVQENRAALHWNELNIPPELLSGNSDKALTNDPIWGLLYGVNPQIRILLGNVQRAKETNGQSRKHMVLFGPPGSGKTTTTGALQKMLGEGSALKLDATSTTRAGLEKLFFRDLERVPPIVIMEEIEKANEDALAIWLGALDDRGEIRKVNFKTNQVRKVEVLFICTVNNKVKFDGMLASALSSRCCTQIYFPRPNVETLRQILAKELRQRGGKVEWIDPAIEVAQKLGVTDPRIVVSYLAGGDRLLDGSYLKDWLAIHEARSLS